MNEIAFKAKFVEAVTEQFTRKDTVHGIYFGEGDPEEGGQHWNFTRNPDDDEGVCTVKEVQQVTVYKGINDISLGRTGLECEFDDRASKKTGAKRLVITYEISEEEWVKLRDMANKVFSGEAYYKLRQ
jgi:hypothetical protein